MTIACYYIFINRLMSYIYAIKLERLCSPLFSWTAPPSRSENRFAHRPLRFRHSTHFFCICISLSFYSVRIHITIFVQTIHVLFSFVCRYVIMSCRYVIDTLSCHHVIHIHHYIYKLNTISFG